MSSLKPNPFCDGVGIATWASDQGLLDSLQCGAFRQQLKSHEVALSNDADFFRDVAFKLHVEGTFARIGRIERTELSSSSALEASDDLSPA